jgi:hypothetical protein
MLLLSAMQKQIETPQTAARESQGDGFRIEEILRRAYQIHREHGGMFGYDFEDWAQAWGELPAETGPELTPESETEVFEPRFGFTGTLQPNCHREV